MNGSNHTPGLSVVVQLLRDTEHFRLMLGSLRAQTAGEALELIVVKPAELALPLSPTELAGLGGCRVIDHPGSSEGEAKAAGVAAARAPLVAFAEDHSYPDPAWAATMLEAHRELADAAVVGPVMDNANPDSSVSWATFLVFYGQWSASSGRRSVAHLPANQSCYKRARLLDYGERLASLLEAESVLHWDLQRSGHRLVLEPGCRVHHLNYSSVAAVVREFFFASRVFAASRCDGWGPLRRACFTLGSPLLPAIRLPRMVSDARRAKLAIGTVLRALAPMTLILSAGAAGELLGYSRGTGRAASRLAEMLRGDQRLVSDADLQQVARLQRRQTRSG